MKHHNEDLLSAKADVDSEKQTLEENLEKMRGEIRVMEDTMAKLRKYKSI
jgi:hypothetical protein